MQQSFMLKARLKVKQNKTQNTNQPIKPVLYTTIIYPTKQHAHENSFLRRMKMCKHTTANGNKMLHEMKTNDSADE